MVDRHITAVLLKLAHSKFKRISPCSTNDRILKWEECINELEKDNYVLYFNLPKKKNSTTLIQITIKKDDNES